LERKKAGTMDDALKILDARLEAYGACINEPGCRDPKKFLRSIGEIFATYALNHDETAIRVGGAAFNDRIQSLYGFFDSNKLK
jgi:hypothetical protein